MYTLAYGDQPALICELVDWARVCGFQVVCAGKGTRYLPSYPYVTPDEVWEHYGFPPEMVTSGDYNPRMFTSFLDGTKSAIEMAAVGNATGLTPQRGGLQFLPYGVGRLAEVCKPRDDGGVLERAGTVEVAPSLERDGRPVPDDLRWGVFVVVRAPFPVRGAVLFRVRDPHGLLGPVRGPVPCHPLGRAGSGGERGTGGGTR